jgi:hypothetical protein
MSRVASVALSLALLVGTSGGARAQQQESPIDQFLRQAQAALDALDYARAEVLARQLLEGSTSASLRQKQQARMILASAYYPEDVPDKRRRAEALNVLRQAVRADMDIVIDRNLTWAGLDSILAEAKRTTLGAAIRPMTEQVVTGPDSSAMVRVRATRPVTFRLTVAAANGGPTLATDSVLSATEGTLRFRTMNNSRPAFTTGDYVMTVVATDPVARDSVVVTETIVITSPTLDLAPIPTSVDSTKLLPERSGKTGAKGIMHAIWVGAGIYAASSLLTADSTTGTKFSPDAKGIPIAAAASGAVLLFSFADPGRKLPHNMTLNRQAHEDLGKQIAATTAENARRISAYRTTIARKTP